MALTEAGASLCNEGPSNAVGLNRSVSISTLSNSTTMMEVDNGRVLVSATSPTSASPFVSRSGYKVFVFARLSLQLK